MRKIENGKEAIVSKSPEAILGSERAPQRLPAKIATEL